MSTENNALTIEAIQYAAMATQVSNKQAYSVLDLIITQNSTVPFIARYRKEVTGNLDEVQIRSIHDSYNEYIEREHRRDFILGAIKEMGQLTPELEKQIKAAASLTALEDIYAPFKAKKKTKGMIAREAGLAPLADLILTSAMALDQLKATQATKFLNPDHKITNWDEALAGALDIIIESIAHDVELKEKLRQDYAKEALLKSEKRKEAEAIEEWQKFRDYFEFSQKISDLKNPKVAHRVLAIRRGMTLKILKVDVFYPEESALATIYAKYAPKKSTLGARDLIEKCAKRAFTQSIHSSLDLEIKTELKQMADEAAIEVFGQNLKQLLLSPYLGPKAVLGVDPGVRTGCKLAVVDDTGKFLVDTVVYPHPPQMETEKAAMIIDAILEKFKVSHVAIGNGTYGRETLAFIEENIPSVKKGLVKATMVSEAGASVYSASDIAREEFPDKDPTVRGAISIARRFQDPLAELVKIDPKSIGVGQYQHDVNQAKLKKSLGAIVESCVNYVGVDINTASAPLLSFVSGIGPTLAQNVVKFREEKGILKTRKDLLNIPRFSQKIFEQCAGFLRIHGGTHPLDATFIHPERYPQLEAWAKKKGISLSDLAQNKAFAQELERDEEFKKEVGDFTHKDIVTCIKAPSQDPRVEFKSVEFRKGISKLTDLNVGEWYQGVVENITHFGAFIDIGIKEKGLVHISEMADRFVENPLEVLKVGEQIKVRVLEIDQERKRISLSCKTTDSKGQQYSAASGGHRPAAKKSNDGHKNQDVPVKNNAFAALKGLKL